MISKIFALQSLEVLILVSFRKQEGLLITGFRKFQCSPEFIYYLVNNFQTIILKVFSLSKHENDQSIKVYYIRMKIVSINHFKNQIYETD